MYTYKVTETRTHHIHLDTPDPDQARRIVDEAIPRFPETVSDVEYDVESPSLLAIAAEHLEEMGIDAFPIRGGSWDLNTFVLSREEEDLCIDLQNLSPEGLLAPADGPSRLSLTLLVQEPALFREIDWYEAAPGEGYAHTLAALQDITELVRRHTI